MDARAKGLGDEPLMSKTSPSLPGVVKFVAGAHCTVLGSAPGRILPTGYASTLIICANGAGYGLSRDADLTVLGAGVSKASDKTSRHTLKNMNGRSSDRVLFVHPGTMTDYPERFSDFGFSWRIHDVITAEERAAFIQQLTGYSSGGLAGPYAHSNGVLALLLAAAAGASRIDASGFSFASGHFYINGAATPRNHANHDTHALAWLAAHAPVFSADPEMRDRFGFPDVISATQ